MYAIYVYKYVRAHTTKINVACAFQSKIISPHVLAHGFVVIYIYICIYIV